MNFCPECENKLYPTEEEEVLYNKCLKCKFKEECKESVIDKKIYKSSGLNVVTTTNKFSIHDPSLPRTSKKECPNRDCPSHQEGGIQEAIFIMNPTSLKLTYICTQCTSEWRYS